MAHSHTDLEMCPSDVRGTLLGRGNSLDGSKNHPHEESSRSSAAVWRDQPALASSLHVDRELDRWRQGGKPEFRGQSAVTENQSVDFIPTEVNPSW